MVDLLKRHLVFVGEWYHEEASIERVFLVYYFPQENAIELFDKRTRKVFLKRTGLTKLSITDFYIGSKLNIFGRQIAITDYGDTFTADKLSAFRQKTLIIIHAKAVLQIGRIITVLGENGFEITNARMVNFTSESVRKLFGEEVKEVGLANLEKQYTSSPCIGLELVAENVVKRIKLILDQNNPAKYSSTLRILFEEPDIQTGVYCSMSEENSRKELAYFFDTKNELESAAIFTNSVLGILKPHALKEGKVGPILTEIYENGFTITGLKMLFLDKVNCQEFYEVYKGVLSDYVKMVAELSNGICMIIEVKANDKGDNTQAKFRTFCGPADPEIAKLLRPNSLRAKYGINRILNAVHCTDLPEDTILELEYFFRLLD